MLANQKLGLGVERIDTNTLKRTPVEPPRGDVIDYISDQHGAVRITPSRPRPTPATPRRGLTTSTARRGQRGLAPPGAYDDDAHTGFAGWPWIAT